MGILYDKNNRGFTLLEFLVASCILAIVISTVFATFTETIKNINSTESQADIYQMSQIALERIHEDLECCLLLKEGNSSDNDEGDDPFNIFSGKNETIDDRDADSLSFLSTKHVSMDEKDAYSGLAKIVFYVKKSEQEESFNLYRTDVSEREQSPEEKTGGSILCEGLHSVNFTYYNADGDEYEDWDSSEGEFKDKLPAMVSIRLIFLDDSAPENTLTFETGVALPMAGNEYGGES